MIEYGCMNYDGDEDCHKCCKHGYIHGCEGCKDYTDIFGNVRTVKSWWEDENV